MEIYSYEFASRRRWPWLLGQWLGLVALGALLAGLVLFPGESLRILWFAIIPVVPATLLISPAIWRGVCPLATLNMSLNGLVSRRFLKLRHRPLVSLVGILLLAFMVPARRFLFNEQALALATTVILVGVLALALGAVFDYKAGFCNAICPVLPVERLYGQNPLVQFENPRCTTCGLCTDRACMDLVPERSLALSIGPERRSWKWLLTPYGVFAAGFPGFVLGYFLTDDTTPEAALGVYLVVFGAATASWAVVLALAALSSASVETIVPVLAGAAAVVYYVFSGPAISQAFHAPVWVGAAIQVAAVLLVAFWLWKKYAGTDTFRRSRAT